MPAEDLAAPSQPRLLVLDDDKAFGEQLSAYLEANGCTVRAEQDARQLDAVMASFQPDLVLLDQRLGETTGTEVLKRLRERSNVPCIVITGMSDPTDRIVNLEIGADDEIDKTVPRRELLARIRAVLRRGARPAPPAPAAATAEPAADAGGWVFSVIKRELWRPDGTPCRLTTAEFEVLRLLHEKEGVPVSRITLSEQVFGRPYEVGDRAVDTAVNKLRRKIEPGEESTAIKSVRPMGYVFAGFPR